MIHAEKIKEITTVKEVWICDLIIKFGELLLRFSPRIVNGLRSYIKHSKVLILIFNFTFKKVLFGAAIKIAANYCINFLAVVMET